MNEKYSLYTNFRIYICYIYILKHIYSKICVCVYTLKYVCVCVYIYISPIFGLSRFVLKINGPFIKQFKLKTVLPKMKPLY